MSSDGKMADRIEREIEEILERLDVEPGKPAPLAPPAEPISFTDRRKRRNSLSARLRNAAGVNVRLTPPTLMFGGAGIMIVGLILAMFVSSLIWLSFAGVIFFIAAFAWSFFRRPAAAPLGGGQREIVWRGRRIEYSATPRHQSKNRFRRFFKR